MIPTKRAANRLAALLGRQPGAYIQQYANMAMLVKATGVATPVTPSVFADLRPYLRDAGAGKLVLDPRKLPAPNKPGPKGPRAKTVPSVHRTVSLPSALAVALEEKAKRDGVSMSGLVLAACETYRHQTTLEQKRVGGTKALTVRFPLELAMRVESYALADDVSFSTAVAAAVGEMLKQD